MLRTIALICGIFSTVCIATIHFLIAKTVSFNLYSFSIFWVLPIGAIIVGMAANSGYYFAARYTHRMLDRYDFLGMFVLSVAAIYAIHFIEYYFFVIKNGMENEINFWKYMQLIVENTKYSLRVGKVPGHLPLGSSLWFNYFMMLLHFIGFLIGGCINFGLLYGADICKSCERYMAKVKEIKVFFESFDSYINFASKLSTIKPSDSNFNQQLLEGGTKIPIKNEGSVRHTWTHKKCPKCNNAILRGEGEIHGKKEWNSLKESDFYYTDEVNSFKLP